MLTRKSISYKINIVCTLVQENNATARLPALFFRNSLLTSFSGRSIIGLLLSKALCEGGIK